MYDTYCTMYDEGMKYCFLLFIYACFRRKLPPMPVNNEDRLHTLGVGDAAMVGCQGKWQT